jgi:hypothetical protein
MIASVQGAELLKDAAGSAKLRIHFAGKEGADYSHQRVVIFLHPPQVPRKFLKQ